MRYEIIISDLCENLDSLDEPDAKAAMIWIVGEYAERSDELIMFQQPPWIIGIRSVFVQLFLHYFTSGLKHFHFPSS